MAISEAFTGTETVGGTEWSLKTGAGGPDAETSGALFHTFLDPNALSAGDVYKFAVYEKVQSGYGGH